MERQPEPLRELMVIPEFSGNGDGGPKEAQHVVISLEFFNEFMSDLEVT